MINTRTASELADAIETHVGRIDMDDWRRIKPEGRGAQYLSAFYGSMISPAAVSSIHALIRETATFEDFKQVARDRSASIREEVLKKLNEPLRSTISTFAGDSHTVPNYIKSLLKRVADITILHLADRRKPIGREEAVRLLSLKTRRGGPEKLRSLQETVSALLGVQIDAFESATPSRRGEHHPNDCAHGVFTGLRFEPPTFAFMAWRRRGLMGGLTTLGVTLGYRASIACGRWDRREVWRQAE